MSVLFWCSMGTVGYAYFGYAMFLAMYVRTHRRPIRRERLLPTVSIVMAARNEEVLLPLKLRNLEQLDYPSDRLEIIVASDGSKDGTAAILESYGKQVVPVILERSSGKAAALNASIKRATGDILVFLDVRQTIDANAVLELTDCFADPEVGAVSGELHLEGEGGVPSADGLGIYWKLEKTVRKLEAASGSVVGVTGAIYAIRRELFVEIPPSTILDDVFVPMQVARQGKRVVFQPSAIARDRVFAQKGKEFSRKVRTLTGNYQLIRLAPWLLSPRNPLLFRFVSHKLLRLLVPFLLVLMLVSSALLPTPFYRAAFASQIVFYMLAGVGSLLPSIRKFKPVAIASTFVMLNAAAAMAFYNFVTRRKQVWVR